MSFRAEGRDISVCVREAHVASRSRGIPPPLAFAVLVIFPPCSSFSRRASIARSPLASARGSCLLWRRAARRQCGAETGEQAPYQAPRAEREQSDGRPAAGAELPVPPCESHCFRKKECPYPACAGRAESVSGCRA